MSLAIAWVTFDVVLVGVMVTVDAARAGRRVRAYGAVVGTIGFAVFGILGIVARWMV